MKTSSRLGVDIILTGMEGDKGLACWGQHHLGAWVVVQIGRVGHQTNYLLEYNRHRPLPIHV